VLSIPKHGFSGGTYGGPHRQDKIGPCDLIEVLSFWDAIWFKSPLDRLWFKDSESVRQGEKPVYKAELKQLIDTCRVVSLHSIGFLSEEISLFTINCPL